MKIRRELSDDYSAIYAVTKAAFEPMSFSDGTEPERINLLRADGDLKLSLVAVTQDRVVGHIAFSPVRISNMQDGWLALGPVSVLPDLQRMGIGSALITTGLKIIKQQSVPGCILIGDPNYYQKFGFVSDGSLNYRTLPDSYVQWLAFEQTKPKGTLIFSAGLE